MNIKKEWFADWFDSPYYHQLYSNRDSSEAAHFIKQLNSILSLKKNSKVVDLACGKGRHALELSKHGWEVLGLDLSANSISEANKLSANNLNFGVHDMRMPFGDAEFSAVFNLFTSIGYFEDKSDNRKVAEAVHKSLNEKGKFLIDFMNVEKVIKRLVAKETKTVNDITFHLERKVVDGYIIKNISFEDEGKQFSYQEKVEALGYRDFDCMLYGLFNIEAIYGDYSLNGFDIENSDRLILLCEKVD